jgi:hypothetical protein
MSILTNRLISGLTNNTSYKFRVAAVNNAGIGTYSAPSNSIIPLDSGCNSLADLVTVLSWDSATQLMDAVPGLPNGVYKIKNNLTYCIMDTSVDGGGWMLAMKVSRGTTFNYSSNYWTTSNTLNSTDTTRDDGDAKFSVFNTFVGNEVMAIWPDLGVNGGSINAANYGWIWKQNMPSSKTLLNLFQTTSTYGSPFNFSGFNSSVWSYQDGYRLYGFNLQAGAYPRGRSSNSANIRWGFAWNNEGDGGSTDASGGIGMSYGVDYSAGDIFDCCGTQGYNRTMRAEIYVR